MNKYVYEEGDYHCDSCGVLGDFNGGGAGEDGIERVILCGEVFGGDDGCYCDKCIEEIEKMHRRSSNRYHKWKAEQLILNCKENK
tara:strand:+ start:510 stop:764 length:255 start_codon:yes stop_codon:yes gene_type:complete